MLLDFQSPIVPSNGKTNQSNVINVFSNPISKKKSTFMEEMIDACKGYVLVLSIPIEVESIELDF